MPPSSQVSGQWIAIIGTRPDGRAEVAQRLLEACRAADVPVGGFLQETLVHEDEVMGYDLIRAATGERTPLARESASPQLCSWGFRSAAFADAAAWAKEGAVPFLDVGRLEAAGEGHWPALVDTLASGRLTVVGVRRGVLTSIALRLPDPVDALELPASAEEVDAFIARVVERHAEKGTS